MMRMLRIVILVVVTLAVVAVIVLSGIVPRLKAQAELKAETLLMATPVVSVVRARHGAPTQEVILPANIQAFAEAPVHARTSGYLKSWNAELGSRVKAGQLLAEIDAPEIEHQIQQARADVATAEANLQLAQTTAARYQDLLKSDAVSRQEVENATGNLAARRTIVQSAEANVSRLVEMQSYQKIYAPFDGVITARNAEVGALVDSGGPAKELFHIASIGRVRIFVNVPQAYWRSATVGLQADVTLPEFPGRRFQATLVTTSQTIDAASHTLLVEFDADNPAGELLPGAYAELHLKVSEQRPTFMVPVNTLLFRSEGVRLAVVRNGNHIVLLPIVIGRDFGTEVEVVSGLTGGEDIVVSPPDSVVQNQMVRVAKPVTAEAK